MSDLVGNSEDHFSHVMAHIKDQYCAYQLGSAPYVLKINIQTLRHTCSEVSYHRLNVITLYCISGNVKHMILYKTVFLSSKNVF